MTPRTLTLDLFADYFQFYVHDVASTTDTGTIWDEGASERMLALGDDLIAVGTARNMTVPVTLEILTGEPDRDFDAWDQVIDCGITVASGKLVIHGCTDYEPDAARISVEPGRYYARIS